MSDQSSIQEVKRPERATADTVAKLAGVSRVAVSRAFNPHASLKKEKRELILKIAKDVGYTPDMAARALVTRRSHLVGVIVPDVCSPWESQEIDALTTALQAEGFATLLFKTRTDQSMDERLLTYMKGFNLDSIIAFAENVTPDTLAHSLGRAVPIYVSYSEDGSLPNQPKSTSVFDRLIVDQKNGIDQAVALMQAYGCKRFAYLGGTTTSLANTERERAFKCVMNERGLPEPLVLQGDYTYESALASTLDLFQVGEGVDGIFSANDVGAFGVIDALRFKLGLRVPEDVKVVGFDDIAQSGWLSYNLTTVKIDLEDRVRALVRLILRRLKDPNAPAMIETLQTRLIVRGTVGS
ncbi:LacI family DNA-binding transcriptional regulator [Pseudovibrio denitrificans]|uniref:LacI family DNA-binding transcriptional regulator n=1 Tax=Pseudovibrio brasiliensis TaxID=1898042 RepID=A0ABX8ASZ0_9HYPH|nr:MULTISPECIES: substrate-binding domain-containing protein [Pseudovibrio]EEA96182.1 transcriptional regulator [Pseudovibrio sp. JE062]QUS57703.1 LacI family DNA-binding transcriptional regulator [Pseudovibrio brasiliensis]